MEGVLIVVIIFMFGFFMGELTTGETTIREQQETCKHYGKIINDDKKFDFICVEKK